MSNPKKPLRLVQPQDGHQTTGEAHTALQDAIDDLFETVTLYSEAGDHEMARAVAKHAHGLSALRIMSRS